MTSIEVVSYRNSTSNHNFFTFFIMRNVLYLIEILHQTTTASSSGPGGWLLYLIEILHQTTTKSSQVWLRLVVSYRNSTSNHNISTTLSPIAAVVSYRNSTSNHNCPKPRRAWKSVVSYRNSTSNHNSVPIAWSVLKLYLIEILHQTTTTSDSLLFCYSCILSKFYIKPQLHFLRFWVRLRCILSKFYIKPQRGNAVRSARSVVSYRNSTSNHNS